MHAPSPPRLRRQGLLYAAPRLKLLDLASASKSLSMAAKKRQILQCRMIKMDQQGKPGRTKGSTTNPSSLDSAQSDTGEVDVYSPISQTNTQTSRLKAQLTASRLMLKGKDTSAVRFSNCSLIILSRLHRRHRRPCSSFDALAGIIEKSKAEQLKPKGEWCRTTTLLMNKASLNMWYLSGSSIPAERNVANRPYLTKRDIL